MTACVSCELCPTLLPFASSGVKCDGCGVRLCADGDCFAWHRVSCEEPKTEENAVSNHDSLKRPCGHTADGCLEDCGPRLPKLFKVCVRRREIVTRERVEVASAYDADDALRVINAQLRSKTPEELADLFHNFANVTDSNEYHEAFSAEEIASTKKHEGTTR